MKIFKVLLGSFLKGEYKSHPPARTEGGHAWAVSEACLGLLQILEPGTWKPVLVSCVHLLWQNLSLEGVAGEENPWKLLDGTANDQSKVFRSATGRIGVPGFFGILIRTETNVF
jgi:hypothetical protein